MPTRAVARHARNELSDQIDRSRDPHTRFDSEEEGMVLVGEIARERIRVGNPDRLHVHREPWAGVTTLEAVNSVPGPSPPHPRALALEGGTISSFTINSVGPVRAEHGRCGFRSARSYSRDGFRSRGLATPGARGGECHLSRPAQQHRRSPRTRSRQSFLAGPDHVLEHDAGQYGQILMMRHDYKLAR